MSDLLFIVGCRVFVRRIEQEGTVLSDVHSVAYFATTGSFAWNGLFPYWLPLFGYDGSILVTMVLMIRAVRIDTQQG